MRFTDTVNTLEPHRGADLAFAAGWSPASLAACIADFVGMTRTDWGLVSVGGGFTGHVESLTLKTDPGEDFTAEIRFLRVKLELFHRDGVDNNIFLWLVTARSSYGIQLVRDLPRGFICYFTKNGVLALEPGGGGAGDEEL